MKIELDIKQCRIKDIKLTEIKQMRAIENQKWYSRKTLKSEKRNSKDKKSMEKNKN